MSIGLSPKSTLPIQDAASTDMEVGNEHPNQNRVRPRHFRRPVEYSFHRDERDRVTLLFGGLTERHDRLIAAAMEGLGYRITRLPTPTKSDLQTGKEFCNAGQCNPAYFTIGALINYLRRLTKEKGLPPEEVCRDYVFVTGGSCGPCRFGMYEAEYRLALRNSGFDGFRVLVFQQQGGLAQSDPDAGLEVDVYFALSFLNAVLIGDLLNETANMLRPYEVVSGQADRVFEKVTRRMEAAMRTRYVRKTGNTHPARHSALCNRYLRWLARFVAAFIPRVEADQLHAFTSQLLSEHYTSALKECATIIDAELDVDFTRPKPICKIVGEFWAQTTEGDGNHNMFRYLESQDAEVLVEPIATWANYLFTVVRNQKLDRRGLGKVVTHPLLFRAMLRLWEALKQQADVLRTTLAAAIFNREYNRLRTALGEIPHEQVDTRHLQQLAHSYYNRSCMGGEGYLEIGKTIHYSTQGLAHMVLSLKPFGCMPSTQSDGAQAAVLARHPDILYIPIETSGEGEINALSRAQMTLSEAKDRAQAEFDACLARCGYTLEEIRDYCRDHPELRRPLRPAGRYQGVIGRAANFVLHTATCMNADKSVSKHHDSINHKLNHRTGNGTLIKST